MVKLKDRPNFIISQQKSVECCDLDNSDLNLIILSCSVLQIQFWLLLDEPQHFLYILWQFHCILWSSKGVIYNYITRCIQTLGDIIDDSNENDLNGSECDNFNLTIIICTWIPSGRPSLLNPMGTWVTGSLSTLNIAQYPKLYGHKKDE